MKTTLRILDVTKEHVGFYTCKAVNDSSDVVTKAKLELASSGVSASITKNVKQTESLTSSSAAATTTTTVSKVSKGKTEKKARAQKKSSASQKIVVREDKVSEHVQSNLIETAKSEELEETSHQREVSKEHVSQGQSVQVFTKEQHFEDENVEIIEETEEIHVKIYKEIFSAEEIENFKVAEEVNSILETIQAHQFGSGERPLRELATIGHLLKKGVEKTEIIQLYNADFFPALKLPESQSALVQLVERQGYENLIAEALNVESTDDENLLASTVGFRAFMRMVEMTNSLIEDLIANFKFEDFVSQEWKHKEIRENEYVEITENRVSSIRAETIVKTGNDFE